MSDTTEPKLIPIDAIGHTAHAIQRNALAICGLYRLYVSKGDQVEAATHSAIDSLADCWQVGNRAAVDACLALVRSRLTTGRYRPGKVADWLTDLAAATDGWV